MIDLNTVNEIYLYTGTTDFRYGIYGLSKIVILYIFMNFLNLEKLIRLKNCLRIIRDI